MTKKLVLLLSIFLIAFPSTAQNIPTEEQLTRWLKRFPKADANGDGKLTVDEARAFQRSRRRSPSDGRGGVPRSFPVHPGWKAEEFPEKAACHRSPEEIKSIYAKHLRESQDPVVSYTKPADGALRIVGTGHSFMAPGYRTFPKIARAAGLDQPPLLTHTGGGITGSARYKWEQENGIFQFDGNPTPKLLSSIANAKWDAMMWGPYYQDKPAYYSCWIDFCLKYNPNMKFYLSDAWPQLEQLDALPKSESELTTSLFERLGREKNAVFGGLVAELKKKYPAKVFVMPTSDAMVLAVKHYNRGELPEVEGIHALIGKKNRSLWRDRLGHLGPGLEQLEGYVFYATLYGQSPELISDDVEFARNQVYPSRALDRIFRKIAWQAVIHNPLSGVVDKNSDGMADDRK